LTASEIGSYEEDGEFYDREKLGLRPNDPIFMKDDVLEKFEFGKPFLTSVELSRRHFPLRRLHNWYMTTSSLGVTNITFQILENAFYSGARIGSIEWEDFVAHVPPEMARLEPLSRLVLVSSCLLFLTCSIHCLFILS
jgi:hypothetical protein